MAPLCGAAMAGRSSSLMMRRMSEGDMWKGLMPWVVICGRDAPESVVRSHVVLVLPLSAVRVYTDLRN